MIDTPLHESDLKIIIDLIARVARRENVPEKDVCLELEDFIEQYRSWIPISEQEILDVYFMRDE